MGAGGPAARAGCYAATAPYDHRTLAGAALPNVVGAPASRWLQMALLREGVSVGRRRIRRVMRKLELWAVRPKRNTSRRPEHKIYP